MDEIESVMDLLGKEEKTICIPKLVEIINELRKFSTNEKLFSTVPIGMPACIYLNCTIDRYVLQVAADCDDIDEALDEGCSAYDAIYLGDTEAELRTVAHRLITTIQDEIFSLTADSDVLYYGEVGQRGLTRGIKTKGTTAMATDVMEPMAEEQVEGNVKDVETKSKRGRKKSEDDARVIFSFPEEMKNENGRIKIWKVDCGYKFGAEDDCNQPVKRELFLDDEVHMDYRIAGKQYKIDLLTEEINDMRRNRDQTASIENVVSREKAKKALKARKQLKKLMAELSAEGVDFDELVSD